jgi:hypothetical protein
MSSAVRPGHARRLECLSAAWGSSKDNVFTASSATVRLSPSTAHGIAATTDTSAANTTSAWSPWRVIRMDRSSFTSDARAAIDLPYIVVACIDDIKGWQHEILTQRPRLKLASKDRCDRHERSVRGGCTASMQTALSGRFEPGTSNRRSPSQ